ncbi:hypothetical protein DPX16_13078 [Anabarilius grahami]|uniref:Uncharacterized protein n=1 Tax=Anabarilius grahami TaxID=495550 RepID=A0A3N0XDS1_ANAGA|nr:hypothetical protein DPX16_13078 [Anabarilius grahami]
MDQTRPRAGLETRCPAFGVYASCPKLFLGRLVGPYAFVYGSCPCRQNQRQMVFPLPLISDDSFRFNCTSCYLSHVTICDYQRSEVSGPAVVQDFPGMLFENALRTALPAFLHETSSSTQLKAFALVGTWLSLPLLHSAQL